MQREGGPWVTLKFENSMFLIISYTANAGPVFGVFYVVL
jgi:hypothetical protein